MMYYDPGGEGTLVDFLESGLPGADELEMFPNAERIFQTEEGIILAQEEEGYRFVSATRGIGVNFETIAAEYDTDMVGRRRLPEQRMAEITVRVFMHVRREILRAYSPMLFENDIQHRDTIRQFIESGTTSGELVQLADLAVSYFNRLTSDDTTNVEYTLGALFADRAGVIDLYVENGNKRPQNGRKMPSDLSYGVAHFTDQASTHDGIGRFGAGTSEIVNKRRGPAIAEPRGGRPEVNKIGNPRLKRSPRTS
jgi:hypothetical protein